MNPCGFPDFLVLRSAQAQTKTFNPNPAAQQGTSTIDLEFVIPPHYYTNQRGSVCAVSVVDCLVSDESASQSRRALLSHNLGNRNIMDTQNTEFVMVSSFRQNLVFDKANPISVLTTPRPTTIKLRLEVIQNSANNTLNPNTTIFNTILRFDYYNIDETQTDFNKGLTKTLF